MNVIRRVPRTGINAHRALRSLHTVPELLHLDKDAGIPGLLSARGLEIAWFEYQQYLVDEMNDLTRDTANENLNPFEIATSLSSPYKVDKTPAENKLLFLASQAYANEFYFRGLKESVNAQTAQVKEPSKEELRYVEVPQKSSHDLKTGEGPNQYSNVNSYLQNSTLESLITSSFDSPEAFRELFITRADAMFGSGYTWLVLDNNDKLLKVVNTYNAGTPLTQMASLSSGNGSAGISGTSSSSSGSVVPLLNFNLWQHAYIHDYGFVGRRRYLTNAFDSINWTVVQQRLPVNAF